MQGKPGILAGMKSIRDMRTVIVNFYNWFHKDREKWILLYN